jgi:UDP-4-amino-4,6-dideoxy-N-acetyl-beta-L-altrosamine N-acetyltransferase
MSLREITKDDLETMLDWRNHPSIRRSMFSQSIIEFEQHTAWFNRESKKDNSEWFLFVDEQGTPSGVVYFIDMDRTANHAFWGFYAAPEAPPGTGVRMAKEALDYFFLKLGFCKVNAEVLESNERSQRFHRKLGFQIEGVFRKHFWINGLYQDVVRYGLLKSEWDPHCVNMRQEI